MASHKINPDLTFTQTEAAQIVKEYVCAICHSSLNIQRIPNEARVFVLCPDHNNVCLVGRVLRSTVNYRVESSTRVYYQFIAGQPYLYGAIWLAGIPREHADEIVHMSVCALCGYDLNIRLVPDEHGRIFDADHVTVKCPFCKTNVGLGGSGFAWRRDYIFTPPIKVREFQRLRKARTINVKQYDRLPQEFGVDKLGVVTFGTRFAVENGEQPNHLSIVPYDSGRHPELRGMVESFYGKTPASVNIHLATFDSPNPFPETQDCYNRGALTARAWRDPSSGEWAWFYYRDPETQEVEIRGGQAKTVHGLRMQREPLNPSEPVYTNGKGKPVYLRHSGRLRFVIPELCESHGSPVVGYFEMIFMDVSVDAIREGVLQAKEYGWNRGMTLSEVPLALTVKENAVGKFVDLIIKQENKDE